jgi:hypothetical protein
MKTGLLPLASEFNEKLSAGADIQVVISLGSPTRPE